VRRCAALAVALIAGLGVFAALPAGSVQTAPSKATAAECRWERQMKRVVRHVRRHGKLRKVVRWKPRWACVPQSAPPVPAPPVIAPPPPQPPPPPAPTPEPEPEAEAEANRLAVKAAEYHYILSRPSVKAGELTVELNNRGEDPHNLNLRQEGAEGAPLEIPETQSLQRNVATWELPAGKYRLWCSLPEHEAKGMYTSLQVE
jgi:plastocyanin